MANFGPANYGKSKQQKHPLLIHDSITHPGYRYEFFRNSTYINDDGIETIYYNCVGCKKLNVNKIPRISVRNNILLNNPDSPTVAHQCVPIEIPKSEALQLDREVREEIRSGKKLPREAFRNAEQQIHIKFAQ